MKGLGITFRNLTVVVRGVSAPSLGPSLFELAPFALLPEGFEELPDSVVPLEPLAESLEPLEPVEPLVALGLPELGDPFASLELLESFEPFPVFSALPALDGFLPTGGFLG